MGAISKFMFEQSFDSAGGTAPPPKARKNYSPAEYDEAVAAAREEGRAAGRAEAVAEAEQVATVALKAAGEHLKALMGEAKARQDALTQELTKAAGAIARKLLPAYAKKQGVGEIETLVAECLGRLHDEPRIVVRVHDDVLDPVRQRLDALAASIGFAGRFVLLAADDIAPGDARIEWADGGVERDTARTWQEIETAIQRFIDEGPAQKAPSQTQEK
jgi:flagellar assembly protein FliH